MRIGIIGGGHIGATTARRFAAAGHDVAIANSRGPETLADLAGERLRPATVADAAAHGEAVLVATPLGAYDGLPVAALAGKVVIDAGNYYPGRDGQIAELDDDATTSSEWLAAGLPGARVVKAFNTLNWQVLRDKGDREAGDQRVVIFLAGDDADAKAVVSGLIEELGFAPVDGGDLATGARRQQAGSEVYGKELTLRAVRAATQA